MPRLLKEMEQIFDTLPDPRMGGPNTQ
jgi:hypothetical protein